MAGGTSETTPGGRAPELLLSADEVLAVAGDAGGGSGLVRLIMILGV